MYREYSYDGAPAEPQERTKLVDWLLCLAALFGAIYVRLVYVHHATIAPDELQHLHAAFLVSLGRTPYVDFFENHTPLFYYIAGPLLRHSALNFETVIAARVIAMNVGLLTMVVAALWWGKSLGAPAARITFMLLIANFFLFAVGSLSYLDTYAALALMISAVLLVVEPPRILNYFCSAFALGVALLFTQKAVAACPAAAFIVCSQLTWQGKLIPIEALKLAIAYAAGAFAAFVLLVLVIGETSIPAFVQYGIMINLRSHLTHLSGRELIWLLVSDFPLFVFAGIGVAARLRGIIANPTRLERIDIAVIYLVSLALGALCLPSVWQEYFILAVPFAGIIAAGVLSAFIEEDRLPISVVLIAAASLAVDVVSREYLGVPPLHRLTIIAAGVGLTLIVVGSIFSRAWRLYAVVSAIFMLSALEQLDHFDRASNTEQRDKLNYILSHSSIADAVFDGYSGLGVFRPHAYHFWYLHEEIQPFLTKSQRKEDIISMLEIVQPKFVILDNYVSSLDPAVGQYIRSRYIDTPFSDIKQLRPLGGEGSS